MTLVFDKCNELQGRSGLHALIAGVSSYPHLPGGAGTSAPESFGMTQLSSSVLTIYKIYNWLLERQNHFPFPLATCRLLLSPSPAEAEPNLRGLTEACTGLRTDVIIGRLDKPPWVDLVLEVEPPEALQVTKVEIKDPDGDLKDGTGNPVELPMPLSPHPYKCKLPGGYYRIIAEIVPPNQGFVNYRSKNPFRLTPINFKCKVKVSP